ncbi:MAG: hypothetical protein C0467_30895 [Planctomycetaceae bacterium]|nr:hypothetical protein [Planctomycetaceae bacterium]
MMAVFPLLLLNNRRYAMDAPHTLYSTGMVADQLGVARWWLLYHLDRGDIPGPSHRVAGRRLFTDEDVRRIRDVLKTLATPT